MVMSDIALAAPAASAVLAHIQDSALDLGNPFSQPILLIGEARIAGTQRHPGLQDLSPEVQLGMRLSLHRDDSNSYDPWSVHILMPDGRILGYLPADINEMIARLMDAGKRVYAIVKRKSMVDSWHRIYIEVYLDD